MASQDLIVWGFLAVFSALILLSFGYIMDTLGQETDYINATTTINGTSINPWEFGDRFVTIFDWAFVLLQVFFMISLFVLGYLVPSRPIFMFVGIIFLIIWLLISPMLSNAVFDVLAVTPLGAISDRMVGIQTFIFNLPLIGLVVGLIMGMIMYGKRGGN